LPTFPVNYTPLAPGRPVRSLIDTVLTYHMTSALTLILNGDAGQQTNSIVVNGNGTPFGYGTGTWSGLAGYASYALSGQWTVSLRGEYFGDNGGLRTGISQKWTEATATAAYAPNSNIIVRGEIRGDKSNQYFFSTGFGLPAYKTNAQFGIETIVKWP